MNNKIIKNIALAVVIVLTVGIFIMADNVIEHWKYGWTGFLIYMAACILDATIVWNVWAKHDTRP